ncbi:fimbrial assembly protein [Pseudomonas syringae]|nr:fimbrial assembly protein [Pseudomonas syringae]MCF5070792.1 fimbrial assembly protein [Pseudomonas syringae]
MIKHSAGFVVAAISALISGLAGAAREEHTFEVSLTIPGRAFFIVPAEPGWIHQAQRLHWDYPTSRLSSVRKYFDVRHDTSAIEARLESAAYLSNGRQSDDIPLRVSFNGVELSPDMIPRQVVTAEDAAAGTRVLLDIEPQQPVNGYRAGDYRGNVMLLFNAKAPGA